MNLTVDASVVVKWFVPESLSEEPGCCSTIRTTFRRPISSWPSSGNTIWKKFRRGEVAFLQPYMDELLGLDEVIALHPVGEQVTRRSRSPGAGSITRFTTACISHAPKRPGRLWLQPTGD